MLGFIKRGAIFFDFFQNGVFDVFKFSTASGSVSLY